RASPIISMRSPTKHPCPTAGCSNLVAFGRCGLHGGAQNGRTSAAKRGYDRDWQRVRLFVLRRDPICQICFREPSTEVDHRVPFTKGGARLDPANLRGACKSCNSAKRDR